MSERTAAAARYVRSGTLSGSILETNYRTRNRSLFFFEGRAVGMCVGGAKVVAKRGRGFFKIEEGGHNKDIIIYPQLFLSNFQILICRL